MGIVTIRQKKNANAIRIDSIGIVMAIFSYALAVKVCVIDAKRLNAYFSFVYLHKIAADNPRYGAPRSNLYPLAYSAVMV